MTTTAPSTFGPLPQFFDNNGVPLSGGLLFTYAGGTTTKISTYTDETGGTPNANPVVLNAAGRPNSGGLWVTPNTSYKFVLSPSGDTDPPTNSLWTVDLMTVALPTSFTGDMGSGGTAGGVPAPPAGTAANGYYLSADGSWQSLLVVPPAASIDPTQAGYLGAPPRVITTDTNLLLADSGGAVVHNSVSPHTITLQAAATIGFTPVAMVTVYNPVSNGVLTIAPAGGVSLVGPTAFPASGVRSLAANGQCVLSYLGVDYWTVVGPGIS